MLFLDGYLVSGGEMAEAIAAYTGILAALAIYLFCARYLTKRTGLIAAAIFYTMPLFSVYNIRGFVDISTAFYTLLAIYAFFLWRETKSTTILILSAAASGFAAATKTSALITPIITAALFAGESILAKRKPKDIARDAAMFCLAAAAPVAPWLARTYAQTGNPLYPLLYNIFGGSHISQMLSTQWVEALKWTGQGTGIKELLMLPWNITMHTNAFGETLGIGAALLAYTPLLILMRNVNGKIKVLLLITSMLTLPWFYSAQILRYAFPIYAILSIAAGYAAARIMQENTMLLKIAATASLALMLLANSAMWIGANTDELKAATGLQPKEDYLKSKVANYELLKYANENLKEAKICLYGDVRGYYSEHDYIWCNPAYQGYIDFTKITTGKQLLERLKEVEATHILVENNMADITQKYEKQGRKTGLKLATNGNKAVNELTKNNAELIYENKNGAVYEIVY
ncbi:glycosyltransferase family 39 protein [Candidatus Woesearchaeota archaeon]|nr:glycosyltransferase family 39 protein [Candidatus Woesearchaeota archaeon]